MRRRDGDEGGREEISVYAYRRKSVGGVKVRWI